jgi:hypothetical protein
MGLDCLAHPPIAVGRASDSGVDVLLIAMDSDFARPPETLPAAAHAGCAVFFVRAGTRSVRTCFAHAARPQNFEVVVAHNLLVLSEFRCF